MYSITIMPKKPFYLRDGQVHYKVEPIQSMSQYKTTVIDLNGNAIGIFMSYEYELQIQDLEVETEAEFHRAYQQASEILKPIAKA